MIVNNLQLLQDVPEWALKRGINDISLEILEDIVVNPELEDQILSQVEYDQACCIKQALEYARDKGLV